MTENKGLKTVRAVTETATTRAPRVEDCPKFVVKRWPSKRRSVGEARHLLLQHLEAWEVPDAVVDSAEVVLSELVTNAVRHGHIPGRLIETRYERLADGVRIEVHDADDTEPERRAPSPDDDSGRGLMLVDALTAGRWGVSARVGVGKLVWAVCADPLTH